MTDREATRAKILNELRTVASNLEATDNFFVYFAGHGQLDDLTGDGYWIPVEGKQKDPVSWVSHSDVKNILGSEKVRAKNIVVIADSCYSGTLLRGGIATQGGLRMGIFTDQESNRRNSEEMKASNKSVDHYVSPGADAG